MDIAAWLRGLGLGQYEPAFRANEIDEGVLPSLTSEDLIISSHQRGFANGAVVASRPKAAVRGPPLSVDAARPRTCTGL